MTFQLISLRDIGILVVNTTVCGTYSLVSGTCLLQLRTQMLDKMMYKDIQPSISAWAACI